MSTSEAFVVRTFVSTMQNPVNGPMNARVLSQGANLWPLVGHSNTGELKLLADSTNTLRMDMTLSPRYATPYICRR
jgi:hypothetical protein